MTNNATTSFKLQESRRFIHQMSQCTSDILYVLDLEKMKVIFINERAADILGYKNIFLESINPSDSLIRMKHLEACEKLNDDEVKEIEVRLKVKDGNWRWFKIRDVAFKRNTNEIVYQILGFAKDIHEQKLAERALELAQEKIKEESEKYEASKKLLQSVFDTVPGRILVYKSIRDHQNKIVDFSLDMVNHINESEGRYSVQVGKTLLSTPSSPEQNELLKRLSNAVENDEPGEEIMHYNEDGYDNWYDIKYQKFEDGVVIAHTDISEIKRTEEDLKESKNFIEHITNTIPDIIYILDLDEKTISFNNDRAYQILGQNSAYAGSQSLNAFNQFLHPHDFHRRMEHIEACRKLKDNDIKEIDIRMKVRNGTWHWFRVRDKAYKRNADDTVTRVIGVAQDIHEQNLITLSLKQAELSNMQ